MSATIPKTRRVMLVVDCGAESPSALVRGLQYRPAFERRNDIKVDYFSRRPESSNNLLTHKCGSIIGAAIKKLGGRELTLEEQTKEQEDLIVERAADYDVVYLVRVPSASLHARLCALGKPRVVVDFSDGLWLPFHRKIGWENLEQMLADSHGVICENDYVADYSIRYNPKTFLVPDPPQVEVFDLWRATVTTDPERVVIGWIGSPATASSLYAIWEPLEDLFAQHPDLHLRIVGAEARDLPRFELVNWSCRPIYSQEEMVKEVLGMDIGLFPQFKTEDSRARGTLKAMIYMSGEATAVCQNFGENPKLIRDGQNGLLADSPSEWRDKLNWLLAYPSERRVIARAGLQTIRSNFTLQRCFQRLLDVLLTV